MYLRSISRQPRCTRDGFTFDFTEGEEELEGEVGTQAREKERSPHLEFTDKRRPR